jgi:hypothetical protein
LQLVIAAKPFPANNFARKKLLAIRAIREFYGRITAVANGPAQLVRADLARTENFQIRFGWAAHRPVEAGDLKN